MSSSSSANLLFGLVVAAGLFCACSYYISDTNAQNSISDTNAQNSNAPRHSRNKNNISDTNAQNSNAPRHSRNKNAASKKVAVLCCDTNDPVIGAGCAKDRFLMKEFFEELGFDVVDLEFRDEALTQCLTGYFESYQKPENIVFYFSCHGRQGTGDLSFPNNKVFPLGDLTIRIAGCTEGFATAIFACCHNQNHPVGTPGIGQYADVNWHLSFSPGCSSFFASSPGNAAFCNAGEGCFFSAAFRIWLRSSNPTMTSFEDLVTKPLRRQYRQVIQNSIITEFDPWLDSFLQ